MICEQCGKDFGIGHWPYCPHGQMQSRRPFHPFWDEHISSDGPVYIDSLAKWNRTMRQNKMELRDSLSRGEMSRRRDRAHEMKRERKHAS